MARNLLDKYVMKKRCPFLEEVVVRYCKAYPVKKMLPRTSLVKDDPCVGCPERCSIYKQFYLKTQEVVKVEAKKEEVFMKESQTKECIWMKAGVVSYRLCTRNYDCKNCEFDQALISGAGYGEQPMIVQALEKLRSLPGEKRMCRYYLTGDLSYKLCSNNYECWHCPVDQMISDLAESHPLLLRRRTKREKMKKVSGFALHSDLYYHPKHFWVMIEKEGTIKLGIDDFASKILNGITEITLPKEGEKIKQEESIVQFRIGNYSISLSSPISGEIKEVNQEIVTKPEVLSQDPYEKGWLVSLFPEALVDTLKDFLRGSSAERWLRDEVEQLQEILKEECEVTISDGGELISDFSGKISRKTWQKLAARFLNLK
ncbi:MAG: hypothetical protein ABIK99_02025 [candidate division WOR-3 bacterium]